MTRLWFRAKRYGWGWTPAGVEGWLVMAAFVVAVVVDGGVLLYRVRHGVGARQALVPFYAVLGGLVVALLVTCWKTGEPPRWRWGS
jgi:hypothetical protein